MQDAKDSTNREITEYLYSRLDRLLMLENRFTAHEGNKHQERSLADDKFRDDDFFNRFVFEETVDSFFKLAF